MKLPERQRAEDDSGCLVAILAAISVAALIIVLLIQAC